MSIVNKINNSNPLSDLALGEDSYRQFKRNVTNTDALAAEMCAFSNTVGGILYIGVGDLGEISGISNADAARINQLISNAASQNIKPPINPLSRNVMTQYGLVIIVEIAEGLNKPYIDLQGRIWVKSGADKRQVTAREEMQRMFQQSGLVYADEVPVRGASIAHLNEGAFSHYFEHRYHKSIRATGFNLSRLLNNLNLVYNEEVPNLAGLLLFGNDPQMLRPAFLVKAVAFPGTVLHDQSFLDSEDLTGCLSSIYERCIAFIKRNLHHIQTNSSFNSLGQLEIPLEVFEEILVNALVHRDYFISAPIRLLIFTDRVEVISPGHLPNHLNTEQIRYGLSNLRNPALASHAFYMLPYRGLGSGIPRATAAWSHLELIDDRIGNQFKVIVKRIPQVTPQVTPQVKDLLCAMSGIMSRVELMQILGLKDRKSFAKNYLLPALHFKVIEMTLPDKPQSSNQRYRVTENGIRAIK